MITKRFTKKKEDFTCEKCGKIVKGTGYTNHCPHCLWSKHVDVNPGDRLSLCQGMMKPSRVEQVSGEKGFVIINICEKCGHVKKNRVAKEDDFDQLAAIQKRNSELKNQGN